MKMYLIAIVIAFIGLWISSEVRADGLCGERSSGVFTVEDWTVQGTKGAIDFAATLRSKDEKAIKGVGGTVEFFIGEKSIANFRIYLKHAVEPRGAISVQSSERRTPKAEKILDADKKDVKVLACVDSVEYSDGSGVIIN
jgi:hypothetical protein